jgi:hypothetical protein
VEDHGTELSPAVLDLLELHDLEEAQQLSLSLNALSGTADGDTVRIRALVQKQVMLLLVDSGSSHSFLNSSFADRVGCATEPIPAVTVRVANNEVMHCDTMVKNFEWWTHGETFSHDMRILPLGAYDAILGMDWLKLHGDMICNWNNKTLTFQHKGKPIVLQGVQPAALSSVTEVSIEQVVKWSRANEVWALAVVDTPTSEAQLTVPDDIQSVLTEFLDVFSEPNSLPPSRVYDHAITLKPGAAPVNARPYRYSPLHKDEIERQVADMLATGVIVQSMSPFASPVLLVQKKDASWRFCVDYRRLNELTIRNTFPMPVIDELLDELAGAQYFSKLDLRAGYHQIRMRPEDEDKTAFKTHHGHY